MCIQRICVNVSSMYDIGRDAPRYVPHKLGVLVDFLTRHEEVWVLSLSVLWKDDGLLLERKLVDGVAYLCREVEESLLGYSCAFCSYGSVSVFESCPTLSLLRGLGHLDSDVSGYVGATLR